MNIQADYKFLYTLFFMELNILCLGVSTGGQSPLGKIECPAAESKGEQ